MRAVLRVLAPLLALVLAAAGVLLVIEVVAAWLRPSLQPDGAGDGVVVPWRAWQATLQELSWRDDPVPAVAIGVGVLGLLLLLVGLLARRTTVGLDGPDPAITVTTSPRVLAQLVGRRVRATEDVAGATVTASGRRVSVTAQGWAGAGEQLRATVESRVAELLDELPLHRRPSVSVSVHERKGPR